MITIQRLRIANCRLSILEELGFDFTVLTKNYNWPKLPNKKSMIADRWFRKGRYWKIAWTFALNSKLKHTKNNNLQESMHTWPNLIVKVIILFLSLTNQFVRRLHHIRNQSIFLIGQNVVKVQKRRQIKFNVKMESLMCSVFRCCSSTIGHDFTRANGSFSTCHNQLNAAPIFIFTG